MSRKNKQKPIIGILTTVSTKSITNPFGSRTPWIRQLVRAGSRKGICYAFTPQSINFQLRSVTAWSYGHAGWHRRTMPLPDVVYNRLPGRRAEKLDAIAKLKANFAANHIPIFNWSFFEKSDIHKRLETSPEAMRHIPETVVSPSAQNIRDLLNKYEIVYLKPTFGSLGIGIYRLSYARPNQFTLRFRKNGRLLVLHWRKLSQMMKYIYARCGRLRNYVAQQGIQLLEINGSPVDFRFHLVKSRNNRWIVAGIGAKQAAKGGVTTHLHSGGAVYAPLEALTKMMTKEAAAAKLQETKNVVLSLAEHVERSYPHLLGELGFDIGIDQNGDIWMFEVNSKPGRSIYKHPALRKDGRQTLRHLLNYFVYLGSRTRTRRAR